MFVLTKRFRRLLSCLAIIASLMSSLQQCHAFCELTTCKTTKCADSKCCCKPLCSKCCCSSSCDDLTFNHSLNRHHEVPYPTGCWCCRPSEPVKTPSDATEFAKELVASGILLTLGTVDVTLSQFDFGTGHDFSTLESESLSAVEFCVQLCRFRI